MSNKSLDTGAGPPKHTSFQIKNENAKNIKNSPKKVHRTAYIDIDAMKNGEPTSGIANSEEIEEKFLDENEPKKQTSSTKRPHSTKRISIFDFEYDFPNSPPKSTNTMVTRSSSVNSPFISNLPSPLRPLSRPYMRPPPRIQTPEWDDSRAKKEEIAEKFDVSGFDVIQTHSQLEYFEAMIQNGDDRKHQHPVQAHEMAEEGMTIVMTKEEFMKTKRYEAEKVENKIPLFWEPRVWDVEEHKMTEEETEALVQNVKHTYCNDDNDKSCPSSKRKKQKSKPRSIISISIYDFMTNASSEDTDWVDSL